jgi:uncharacterized protein YndB with AHSA1/START domain
MSEYGTLIDSASVRFERVLPGPIERVWSYLVDPELRGTWFASGPLEPRVGGSLKLTFQHSRLAPPGETAPAKHGRRGQHDGRAHHAGIRRTGSRSCGTSRRS